MSDLEKVNGHHAKELLSLPFAAALSRGEDVAKLPFDVDVAVGAVVLAGIGVLGSIGGYLVSQAYRISQAGLIAPFEYVAMPLAILWSIALWGDWPDAIAWLGIVLIAGAGLFVFLREMALGNPLR